MSQSPDFLEDLRTSCLQNIHDAAEDLSSRLTELNQSRADLIRELLRACHTWKGDTQAVGFQELASFIHRLEDALEATLPGMDAPDLSTERLAKLEWTLSRILSWLMTKVQENPPKLAPGDCEDLFSELRGWNGTSERDPEGNSKEAVSKASQPEIPPTHSEPNRTFVNQASSQAGEKQILKFLRCKFAECELAIPVHLVTEILSGRRPQKPPVPDSRIEGFLSVRGESLPVVNTGFLLGRSGVAQESGQYTLVVSTDELRMGFQIDEVHEIIDVPEEQLTSRNGRKIFLHEGKPTQILDLARLERV